MSTMASLEETTTRQRQDSTIDATADNFQHTHIFYISPHSVWNPKIKIHDITSSITASYPSDDFKAATEAEGQARAKSEAAPEWIVLDYGFWKTSTLHTGTTTGETKKAENTIATWKPSKGQHGKNTFIFPETSTFSSHPIVMQREKKWTSFDEVFVVDSIQYFWRYNGHSRRKFTLWKVIGQSKVMAAKYKGKARMRKRGGTLLVNSGEVDSVVAVISMLAMLRKVRQRD